MTRWAIVSSHRGDLRPQGLLARSGNRRRRVGSMAPLFVHVSASLGDRGGPKEVIDPAMSALLFKVLHLLGVFLLFAALGGLVLRAYAGQTARDRAAKLAAITHGLALVILLVTGFGMLGMLKLGVPGWAWVKLGVWLAMGALVAVIRRSPSSAGWLWWLLPALGLVAAWLALYKPF